MVAQVLRKRLNLRFEESLLRQIMKEFDDTGSGDLDYRKFCELVMGSKKTSASSLAIGGPKGAPPLASQPDHSSQTCSRLNCWPVPVSTRRWSSGHVSADSGNSEMMIRRKVHLSFKPLLKGTEDAMQQAQVAT